MNKGSNSLLFKVIVGFLASCLLLTFEYLQLHLESGDFLKLIAELAGSFVVTFFGVLLSFNYSKKLDHTNDFHRREKIYRYSLKSVASELIFNNQCLQILQSAIIDIPRNPDKLYRHYGLLISIANDIKFDVFNGLIASGAMEEVSDKDEIFNKIQAAYYNLYKSINGLKVSSEVFIDYDGVDLDKIPLSWIEMAYGIVDKETEKLCRTNEMTKDAVNKILIELKEYKIEFIDKST
jgi:hypothetical protein